MRKMVKAVFVGLLFITMFTTVFSCPEPKEETSISNPSGDLTHWMGINNSFTMIFDHPDAQGLMEAIAQHKKGYTPEMVKAEMVRQYEGVIEQFEVFKDGRTVLINGTTIVEYDYFGKLETRWEEYDIEWYIFLSSSPEARELGVRTLLLMTYHGHGEGSIPHCHARYSNRCFANLTTSSEYDTWWPTFYRPSEVDVPEAIARMKGMARMLAANLPDID